MISLAFLITVVVHSIIVVWITRRVARWHVPGWLVLILSFTLFGTVIGLITMAIPDYDQFSRIFVNPLGVSVADYIHDNWYTPGLRPDNWESILPWVLKYPQVYGFSSIVFGAILGIIITLVTRLGGDLGERAGNLFGIDILPTNRPF